MMHIYAHRPQHFPFPNVTPQPYSITIFYLPTDLMGILYIILLSFTTLLTSDVILLKSV